MYWPATFAEVVPLVQDVDQGSTVQLVQAAPAGEAGSPSIAAAATLRKAARITFAWTYFCSLHTPQFISLAS
jgi:hypothetical protein